MSKVLRLFISSTFEDFRLERAVLQKFVFPEVREIAHKKELSFLPIDLRWGVSDESQIDQRTMDICLDEVVRASIEPHPDFLILSGDKYGWIPLPRVIEEKEFEAILNKLKELNQDISILEKWYKLDKNQLPASYILKAKDVENDKDYTIWKNWEQVENEIRKLLQFGVNNLDFATQTKAKYFTSATHEEFKTLLKHKEDKELKEHIFTFIRKFKTINNEKLFDENSDKIETFRKELKNNTLKDNLKEVEVSSKFYEEEFNKQKENKNYFIENIFEDINSLEELKEIPEFGEYLVDFANFIKNKLINSINSLNIENLSEKYYQKEYKNYILSKPLISRDNEIKEIKEAIEKNNKLLIYGESGVGKSAIMAKVIDDLENENIIYRFCKATPTSSSLVSMLNSILKELGFEIEEKEKNLNDLANSQEDIKKELQEIGYKLNQIDKKTIIILDAIDQLGSAKIDELEWLPYNDNIKLVISTLNDKNYQDDTEYYQKLKSMISSQIEIKRLENPQEILKELLKKENRTLTDEQYKYVLNKPDSNKPLYLTIAKEEVKFWQSTDTLTDDKTKETKNTRYLSDTQQNIIKEFISNLSTIHYNSKELVDRVFGYISASKQHLSEELLLKVLSKDKELLQNIENKYHKNLTNDLPPAVWARFRWMIKDYITEDIDGYIKFYHREFESIIDEFYSNELAKKLTLILENMFPEKNALIAHFYILVNMYLHNETSEIDWKFLNRINEDSLDRYNDILLDKIIESSKFTTNKLGVIYGEIFMKILEKLNTNLNDIDDFEINNNYVYLTTLLQQGQQYFELNEIKKAEETLKNSIKLAEEISEIKDDIELFSVYIQLLLVLGKLYRKIDFIQEAKNLFQKILSLMKNDLNELYLYSDNFHFLESYVMAYQNMLFIENYDNENLSNKIDIELKQIKEIFDNDKNSLNYLMDSYLFVLDIFAVMYSEIGEPYKAEELYKEILSLIEEIENFDKNGKFYASILSKMGMLYIDNDKEKAFYLLEESLNIRKKGYEDNPDFWIKEYIESLNQLSIFYMHFQQLDNVQELFNILLKIIKKRYEDNPDFWIEDYITILNNFANLYFQLEDIVKLEILLKEELEIVKEVYYKDKKRWMKQYTQALNNLGELYRGLERNEEAFELLKEALHIKEDAYENNPSKWAQSYVLSLNNLGLLYYQLGRINESIELLKKSLDIIRKEYMRYPEKLTETYIKSLNNLVDLLKSIGEVKEAIELEKEKLEITRELYKSSERWNEDYMFSLNNLADSYVKVNNFNEGYKYFNEYFEIFDINNIISINQIKSLIYPFIKYYQLAIILNKDLSRLDKYIQNQIKYLKNKFGDEYCEEIDNIYRVYKELANNSYKEFDKQKFEIFKKLFK